MFFGVKRTNTEPDSPMNLSCPQLFMHEGGAVKSGPAGNVIVHIEHSPGIHSFKTVDVEEEDADMVCQVILIVESHALDFLLAHP